MVFFSFEIEFRCSWATKNITHGNKRHLTSDTTSSNKNQREEDTNENQFRCAEIELNLLHEAERGEKGETWRNSKASVIC